MKSGAFLFIIFSVVNYLLLDANFKQTYYSFVCLRLENYFQELSGVEESPYKERSMLELKKGEDILMGVGGVTDIEAARTLFADKLDSANIEKLQGIKNEEALIKVANAIAMCKPDYVFVNTGSAEDVQWIREYSLRQGEEEKLAKEGHTIHYDLPQDQARLVKQTFYIVNEGENMSSLAKTVPRDEALGYVKEFMPGIMNGKSLIIGFYSRGPVGAEATIPAIEISSSGYVLHSAEILYRNCFSDFDAEVERAGIFYTNVHSEGSNRPEDVPNARIFMDRSWFTTYATFCTYAGNTLLLKKGNHRFSVDYATYYKLEEQLSEHMFITGLTGPGGRKTFLPAPRLQDAERPPPPWSGPTSSATTSPSSG